MREFQVDHRDNPGLHNLYVGWALDLLQIINPVIDELRDRSNWNFSQAAMALSEVRRKLILEDAAFFEATALLAGEAWEEIRALQDRANGVERNDIQEEVFNGVN